MDIDGGITKSSIGDVPPAISQLRNPITCPTSLMATKFKHQSKKKIAIVTPEQRTKKSFPSIAIDSSKTRQDENNVTPTFSLKQLLSSKISKKINNDWERFELNDHQIFSMDCKKIVQVLSKNNTCINNNNEEKDNKADLVDNEYLSYKCLECDESLVISNENFNDIVSHICSKWHNNFLEEHYSPKKHIGKLFDQHQAIAKWSVYRKESNAKTSTNLSMLTIIRCRKCKLYFPGSFENRNDKCTPIQMLLEHSHECHTRIINEWKHHQSLSIKSLR